MPRLEWSSKARTERFEIIQYIAKDNVTAAIAIGDRIARYVSELREFPELGKPGRVRGSRELVIPNTNYVVAYRIKGEVVRILRVLHGKQQWPRKL